MLLPTLRKLELACFDMFDEVTSTLLIHHKNNRVEFIMLVQVCQHCFFVPRGINARYDTRVCYWGGSKYHLKFTLEFQHTRGADAIVDQPLVWHRGGSREGYHLSVTKLPEALQA